jgi:hypothetical protein
MRPEVIIELKKRIEDLRKVAKPNDIPTGMTGSFTRFIYYLEIDNCMTPEEFDDGVYDDWLREKQIELYNQTQLTLPEQERYMLV